LKISLPYGRGEITLELPDFLSVTEIEPSVLSHDIDTSTLLRRAIDDPVGSEPLERLLDGAGSISVLISDITRSGSIDLLRELLSILRGYGVNEDRLNIILATGMHRHLSDDELAEHFGKDICEGWKIFQHDPRDRKMLVKVGESPRGTPYEFSRLVTDSDIAVVLGSISFHYFAGFGGGRKLLLPGVAGEETIISNHRLSLKADPAQGLNDGCKPGNLEGNPVHEDMLQGIRALKTRLFSINYIMGDDGGPVFINAGDIVESHREACNRYYQLFSFPIERKYRCAIISAGGHPKDINLLQAHKALRHVSFALEEGALIFAAVRCPEGVGSQSYLDAFSNGLDGVADRVREKYTLNSQTAVSTGELVRRFSIYVKSDLDESLVERFGFLNWVPEQTGSIIERYAEKDILVIRNASTLLPVDYRF